jgi:thymidine phosphorylase
VVWHARPGDRVTEGAPLFTLLTDDESRFERALESLDGGYDVESHGSSYRPSPLILDRIS